MEKQIVNNGHVLLEKGNIVHLMNNNKTHMAFECVDIDNGYLVLEPLDAKRFGNDPSRMNQFITGKPIIKGIIEYGNKQ